MKCSRCDKHFSVEHTSEETVIENLRHLGYRLEAEGWPGDMIETGTMTPEHKMDYPYVNIRDVTITQNTSITGQPIPTFIASFDGASMLYAPRTLAQVYGPRVKMSRHGTSAENAQRNLVHAMNAQGWVVV